MSGGTKIRPGFYSQVVYSLEVAWEVKSGPSLGVLKQSMAKYLERAGGE